METYKNKEWLKQQFEEVKYAKKIGEKCGVSGDTIEYWRKKFNIDKNPDRFKQARKYFLNEDFFESIDNEEKAYWLGFLMADGCVVRTEKSKPYNRIEVNLKEEDINHLNKLQKAIGSNYEIKTRIIQNKKLGFVSTVCSLRINSIKMTKDLIALGVVPNKTGKESMPAIDRELKGHFIRGFFDGDGSFTATNSLRIGCSSKDMLEAINLYFNESLGISFKIYENLVSYSAPFYIIDSNHSRKNQIVLTHLYKNSNVSLDRKHKHIFRFINSSPIQ